MNFSGINKKNIIGKVLRFPLQLIPKNTVVPILQGKLKGKKWIVGSSTHGCWLGSYEYEKQKLFEKEIKPGMAVYDIGSNVGFYTLLASQLVGEQGSVYAFEPVPRNIFFLKKHLQINKVKNVRVIGKAVTTNESTVQFSLGSDCSSGFVSKDGSISVDSVSLDKFIEQGNPLPDLIKMDIEGGEYLALQGAENILKKSKPIIFLATHGKQVHLNCIDFLQSIDYKIYSLHGENIADTNELIAR